MRSNNRFWLLTILLLVLSLLAAQCQTAPAASTEPAGDAAATDDQTAADTTAGEATGDEKIELRLWMHQNPSFIQANEEIIRRFEEAHPEVTIKLESFEYSLFIQTLQTSMPAGTEADIIEMFGTWVCSYANGGRLAELSETVISKSEAEEQFFRAPLEGYTCDGKLYGLPNEFNIENGAVLVSKKMFDEAGMDYPPQWETMPDLLSDAEKLAQWDGDTMTVSGFHFISGDGLAFQLLAGILQRGGEYMKPDGSGVQFTTPEAKETLEDMKSWITDYKVTDPFLFNGESNWVGTSFFNNQVAIGFIGPWIVPNGLAEYPDTEFDYVSLPNYAGDKHLFAADSGWGKVVSINSQHKDLAMEFVKFHTTVAENAKFWNVTTGTVPALISVANDPTLLEDLPYIAPSLKVLEHGRYIGQLPDRDLFWYDIVQPHVLAVLQDTETVDDALLAIEEETNATFQ
jgi:multiple sugar transport system substrate-binding protein